MHPDARGADAHGAAFTIPAGACDTHFHVFEPGYPHVAEPLYTFPDGTTAQYLAMTEALGIERMVLVQPTFYGTDNRLLVDTLKRLGPRCGGVVRIEESATEAELDAFHAIGVRAIRLDLFARAGWPTSDIIGYIRRMAARATPRGWHLQFYTPGTIVRDLLPFLADLADTFVIDHMGYMTEPDPDFEERLLRVLRQGSCWIKLSGSYRVAKSRPLSSVTPWGRALAEARPDRLLWGSDWPHLPDGQRDTGELLNLLAEWVPTEEARRRILVDSPNRLFFRLAPDRGRPVRFISQPPLEQLAAGIAGQRGRADRDVLRDLEVGDMSAEVVEHRGHVERGAGRGHDHGAHLLAHHLVGHAKHRRLVDSRRPGEGVLDLDAVHVLAAAVDHVLHPVHQVDQAFVVDPGEIARPQPAAAEGRGGRFGLIPVARDNVGPADQQFAGTVGQHGIEADVAHRGREADRVGVVDELVRQERRDA